MYGLELLFMSWLTTTGLDAIFVASILGREVLQGTCDHVR